MARKPSLFHQFRIELERQLCPGVSKHEVKQRALEKAREKGLSGRERWVEMNRAVFERGIFSYGTLKAYLQACKEFSDWAKERYKCRTMEEAKRYVGEYLRERLERGVSAWTLKRDRAALRKAYRDRELAREIELPKRRIRDVHRSRELREMDRHISMERYRDVVDFCRATGLRRAELERLRVEHVREENGRNGRMVVWVEHGKGGKSREVRVRRDMEDRVREIVREKEREGRDRLFERVPVRLDVHGYRREYAKARYNEERARGLGDREARLEVTHDLGHRRLDVLRFYV